MNLKSKLKAAVRRLKKAEDIGEAYLKRFTACAFTESDCKTEKQFEAVITKKYHSVEKGLAYPEYRAGFGKDNILSLVACMNKYAEKYGTEAFFYKTAVSVLKEYLRKNKEYGHEDAETEAAISSLKGEGNSIGGAIEFTPFAGHEALPFDQFAKSRHSIRYYSDTPVDIEAVKRAIQLAQQTPSACNRQGWRSVVAVNSEKIKTVLANQNGSRGFADNIKCLITVTADTSYFTKSREHHQPFIDGGMYAMNLLHALHHEGLATVPLSASLNKAQDDAVRKCLGLDRSEVLIMFIGVGNYPEKCVTTASDRREAKPEIV